MPRFSVNVRPLFLFLVLAAWGTTGCATLKKKFSGSVSVNMTPFAENTLVLISELDYGLPADNVILIEKYIDVDDPDVRELRSLVNVQRTFLKGIVEYSVKIVSLGQSELDDRGQVNAYAAYLKSLVDWFVLTGRDRGSPSSEEYKAVLEKVAAAEDLLGGLRAAQPLILRFNEINLALAREIAAVKLRVVEKTVARLAAAYAETLALGEAVHERKERLAGSLRAAVEKNGNPVAYRDDARRYHDVQVLWQEVQADVQAYLNAKKLIGRVVKEHDDMVRRGGKTIYLWTNAHQKMASGVRNPAEWFPLTDVKALVGTAGSAVLP